MKNKPINRQIKRKEKINVSVEENDEIVRFVKVLAIVIVCIVGIYIFTRIFVTKDLFNKDNLSKQEEIVPLSIDYNNTTLGALLNRPYKDYYVFAYSSKDKKANYYNIIASVYRETEDNTKLYWADLNSPFNDLFVSEESNYSTNKVDDLKVKGPTLIKVSNNKIVKFIENMDDIVLELKPKEK